MIRLGNMSFRSELEKAIRQEVRRLYKDRRYLHVRAERGRDKLGLDPALEHPKNEDFGDYATAVPLTIASELKANPLEIAQQLKESLTAQVPSNVVAQIEVTPPGFINFWLRQKLLVKEAERVLKEKDEYGSSNILKGRRILLEHTSPNPQTTIMLGHLRNNFLGMAAANILEFQGAKVVRDCVVNDRGVHICKAIWGYLVFAHKKSGLKRAELLDFRKISDSQIKKTSAKVNWRDLLEGWVKKRSTWLVPKDLGLKADHTNLIWYVLGSQVYNLSAEVRAQVEEILVAWEAEDKSVWQIWQQILKWSEKGYQETYERIRSIHDWVWRESELYKEGKELVDQGLKKDIFRRSKGAIVSDLGKYGLPDTVLIKSDGTAVYHTYDLNLVAQKRKKFPSDLYIWDIGAEQTLYFKQLFAMSEQLGIGKREDFFHLAYALVNFKGGKKMSTRRGEVVAADKILDELHRRALSIIETSNQKLRGKLTKKQLDQLAEEVAVGAVKYSLLKFARNTTIQFDMDESLALEGNAAPYLQYTHARCQSVLHQAKGSAPKKISLPTGVNPNPEEVAILRTIYRFPEVVSEAGERYAPNLICNFLFDLAQKYNLFYNQHPIIKSEPRELRNLRLALTTAVGQVIKNGLGLLGITVPARM